MGKVKSYEQQLEAHRKWKEAQEKKKQLEEQRRLRREEEIKKDAERRKKREARREEERKRREEVEWNKHLREMRKVEPSHANSGDIYSEFELRHLKELHPNEIGELKDRYWQVIEELREKRMKKN